jgi:predicted nucleotidyltransferase
MSLRLSPAALASTGLPESALAAIQQVLAAHPAVQQAILYGSRALGRHRPASDIDLTLLGPDLSSTVLARIDAELDDLLLPWVIDLSCHASLRHAALLAHIQRYVCCCTSGPPRCRRKRRGSPFTPNDFRLGWAAAGGAGAAAAGVGSGRGAAGL